ncbi:MAG: hypothetical protein DWQ02_27130 [Bacteroidetes bacterium]|nr:MAG: hypothetical protein DWQ02_27130 [Bacteroidota bacterium]
MSDMNFEHIRHTLLETQEFEYHPEDWAAVDRALRPRRRKGLFFIFLFAGVGVLTSGVVLSQFRGGHDQAGGMISGIQEERKFGPETSKVLIENNEATGLAENIEIEKSNPVENLAEINNSVGKNQPIELDKKPLPPVKVQNYEIQEDLYATGEMMESEIVEKELASIETPVFLPILDCTVKQDDVPELPEGKVLPPQLAETQIARKIHGRIAVGLTFQPGQNDVFPGNGRTPKAAGQSVQVIVPLNDKNMVGLQLRSQRSYSYHDSLLVEVANQYYPDWSDDFELFYDSLDVAQKSLTLDLTYYRTVFNKPWGNLHFGLGGRFSLKRDQRVDSVIKNIYLGRLVQSNNVSFQEVFKGIVPELLIDVPIYKGLGVSFGMEYSIPVSKEVFDIEPQFSGFGRLYYEF